jgi:hypothetical protein
MSPLCHSIPRIRAVPILVPLATPRVVVILSYKSTVSKLSILGRLFTFEWTEDFPLDGEYIFRGLCDNKAQLYVDNLKVTDLGSFGEIGRAHV